jgi:hypothetical protein
MSPPLISRSADLRRLRDEGYEVAVVGGHLTVGHVPYVDGAQQVRYGTLVSELTLAGDVTGQPSTHVVYFAGELPCDHLGIPLAKLVIENQPPHPVTPELVAQYTFSSKPKPPEVYVDYYHKMTTYIAILVSQARMLEPDATAQTYRPVTHDGEDSVFAYVDTASSRAGVTVMASKLKVPRIALVGLGGTGDYILDFVAKTPVREIHLFDDDYFLQHNAFRAPGAATIEQLLAKPLKVDHFTQHYSAMHRGVVPHPYRIDESNVTELDTMSFVFLSIDDGPAKKVIMDHLEARQVPFIDVGMGLYEVDGRLAGVVRTTLSTEPVSARAAARKRISLGTGGGDQLYDRNIQISELNAYNAASAVIRWKKQMGFYNDLEEEHHSTYSIDTNELINDDQP